MRLRNSLKETLMGDFPGGPVVRIFLAIQGDVGSIPDHRTKIPYSTEQLSESTATTELVRKDLA